MLAGVLQLLLHGTQLLWCPWLFVLSVPNRIMLLLRSDFPALTFTRDGYVSTYFQMFCCQRLDPPMSFIPRFFTTRRSIDKPEPHHAVVFRHRNLSPSQPLAITIWARLGIVTKLAIRLLSSQVKRLCRLAEPRSAGSARVAYLYDFVRNP